MQKHPPFTNYVRCSKPVVILAGLTSCALRGCRRAVTTIGHLPRVGRSLMPLRQVHRGTAARRRKIGTQVVQALSVRNPDRRLLAYSEGADEFWASLGWDRFDHPDGRHRALFIQPERHLSKICPARH
ncbi:hypothetical protein MNVM_21310 [Mycobacterium novum]|uniref:Uncharacterized protein n=1 Tax=Mycobacterium novum TaxID=2492438 RepID=A0A7I7JML3_9MYCO|nr:hypothetical protein MNVM_21310 [Mycobacterium novum]